MQSALSIHKPDKIETGDGAIHKALLQVSRSFYVWEVAGTPVVTYAENPQRLSGYRFKAFVPALRPQDLGDPTFKRRHHLRYAYVAGAMAKGIASVALVEALARTGVLGFFGAAGLPLDEIEKAIICLQHRLRDQPFGFSLTHSPDEPGRESSVVNLYLRYGIRLIEASAYVDLTLPLVFYRIKGIYRGAAGQIVCPNQIVAKVSHVEVARRFLSPPPERMIQTLLANRQITFEEAELARSIPMAQDLLVEADSGGHTDNRPALVLWPLMLALHDEINLTYQYPEPVRVGLGGGSATPEAAAGALSMGAACILTGSINQACVEAGTSLAVREMLAAARHVDVAMAPSADLFERGGQVQVLKRGTAFPSRARKLYDLYCQYDSLESIPPEQKTMLEQDIFKHPLEEEWSTVKDYFARRDPRQLQRAESDPKHKLALTFRSYMGQSSTWAMTGDPARRTDYQIWCGPAMGGFNDWVKDSFLEKPANRHVALVTLNLLLGAAVAIRANWLHMQGILLPPETGRYRPMRQESLSQLMELETTTESLFP